jgi:integrase
MGAYLRGRWWWYKRMLGGRVYYRALKIRKGQESMLSARLAQEDAAILAAHYGLPCPDACRNVTLSEFIPVYRKRKSGKASLDRDIQRFNLALPIIGDKRLADFTMDDFQGLEKKLLEDHESATVNRYIQAFHHLFEIAIREKALAANPLDNYEYFVEDRSGRRALSDDEISTLLVSLRRIRAEAQAGPRHMPVHEVLYDLALFGLLTGARLSEIIGLKRAEIDRDIIRLPIGRTKFRRRGRQSPMKAKRIFMSPEALEVISRQPPAGEYVFPLERRDPRVVSKAVHQLRGQGKLGVPDFTFHMLRHTWVSRATEITDGPTVQSMAGHSDYRTTLGYTHSDEPKMRAVASKMGTILRAYAPTD